MPNCFRLTAKDGHLDVRPGDKESFLALDVELCESLGIPISPIEWCRGWYDNIGLNLALGNSLEQIRGRQEWRLTNAENEQHSAYSIMWRRDLIRILDYLIENYTTDAWYEMK